MSLKNIVIAIIGGFLLFFGVVAIANEESAVGLIIIVVSLLPFLYLSGALSVIGKHIEKTKLSLDEDIASLKRKKEKE